MAETTNGSGGSNNGPYFIVGGLAVIVGLLAFRRAPNRLTPIAAEVIDSGHSSAVFWASPDTVTV